MRKLKACVKSGWRLMLPGGACLRRATLPTAATSLASSRLWRNFPTAALHRSPPGVDPDLAEIRRATAGP